MVLVGHIAKPSGSDAGSSRWCLGQDRVDHSPRFGSSDIWEEGQGRPDPRVVFGPMVNSAGVPLVVALGLFVRPNPGPYRIR